MEFEFLGEVSGKSEKPSTTKPNDSGIEFEFLDKATEQPSGFLRQAADIPIQFAKGIGTGTRGITDIIGADNPVSKMIAGYEDYMDTLLSAESRNDSKRVAQMLQEAKDGGFLDKISAGFEAFASAPLETTANVAGYMVPQLAIGIVGKAAQLGKAAQVGLTLGTGFAQGVGNAKGNIYQNTKEYLREQGVPEDQIEPIAVKAQSYNGENLDQLLLSGGLNALAAKYGAEAILTRVLAKEGKEVSGGIIGGILKGAAKEGSFESVQSAQEEVSTKNIPLQRLGYDVPTFQGAIESATTGLLAGGFVGGLAGGAEALSPEQKEQRDIDKEAERRARDLEAGNAAAQAISTELTRLERGIDNKRMDLDALESTSPEASKMRLDIAADQKNLAVLKEQANKLGLSETITEAEKQQVELAKAITEPEVAAPVTEVITPAAPVAKVAPAPAEPPVSMVGKEVIPGVTPVPAPTEPTVNQSLTVAPVEEETFEEEPFGKLPTAEVKTTLSENVAEREKPSVKPLKQPSIKQLIARREPIPAKKAYGYKLPSEYKLNYDTEMWEAAPVEAPAITPAPVAETPAVTEAPAAEVAPAATSILKQRALDRKETERIDKENAPVKFTTQKGSQYSVGESGTIYRDKFDGKKFKADKIGFVSKDDADKIAELQNQYEGKAIRVIHEPNKVRFVTDHQLSTEKTVFEATTSTLPQEGMYPIEGSNFVPHLGDAIISVSTPTPAVSETITPAGISVGNRIKLGKSPQTYIVEEVVPQSEVEKANGEQYYSVKNEKTGEVQVVEKADMKQVKKSAKVAPIERDMTKPEQMTPDEADAVGMKLPRGRGADILPSMDQMAGDIPVSERTGGVDSPRYNHAIQVATAARNQQPVSAVAVDTYGITLPEGYTKQGDLYVYKPEDTRKTVVGDTQYQTEGVIPEDQRFTEDELRVIVNDIFEGKIPDKIEIITDDKDPNKEFKAAYSIRRGTITYNLAYLAKGDDLRFVTNHELGHFILGDPKFQVEMARLFDTLPTDIQEKLKKAIGEAYAQEGMGVRAEETIVFAFGEILENAPDGRNILQRFLDAIRDAINRLFKTEGYIPRNPKKAAAAILMAARNKFERGEFIRRPNGSILRMTPTSPKDVMRDAEYLAAVDERRRLYGDCKGWWMRLRRMRGMIRRSLSRITS
jgi:hypothetical protein